MQQLAIPRKTKQAGREKQRISGKKKPEEHSVFQKNYDEN
jgi:hypothetical protein